MATVGTSVEWRAEVEFRGMGDGAQQEWATELDKSRAEWGEGPWTGEPDRVEWKTRAGLVGLIVRNHMGALCGYAAVPPGHPLHGRDPGDLDVTCHGGLTYGEKCRGPICHVPAPGEPDDVWWFGFDCAHAFDQVPGLMAVQRRHNLEALGRPPPREAFMAMPEWTYKDIPYVTEEVEDLAEQLVAYGDIE